ncbi:hypothetical protein D1872_293390 [compost metagenome]
MDLAICLRIRFLFYLGHCNILHDISRLFGLFLQQLDDLQGLYEIFPTILYELSNLIQGCSKLVLQALRQNPVKQGKRQSPQLVPPCRILLLLFPSLDDIQLLIQSLS